MKINDDILQVKNNDQFHVLLKKLYQNEYPLLISHLSKELNKLYRISIRDAEKYLLSIINLFKYIPKTYQYKLLGMQARMYAWKTEYALSIKYYEKALNHAMKHRKFQDVAMIRKGMVDVYLYLSEYSKGLEEGKKALRYFRQTNQESQTAQVMTNIGNIYHRMDKNRQALSYYDKAKDIFSKQGGVATAIVDFNRANIFANMNELQKAKKLYLQAGMFYKKNNMHLAYQQTEYSIAYLYYLDSKYSDALNLFEQVYDSFEKLDDKAASAVTQLDLAELNLELNQYGSTIMLCELIIPIFSARSMSYEEGKGYYFTAIAKLQLGDIEQAKRLLAKASKIFLKEKNNLWLGMIESTKNNLAIKQKKYTLALATSVKAQKLFKKSSDIRREHDAIISFIQVLFLVKREREAQRKIKQLQKRDITEEQKRKIFTISADYYFSQKSYSSALENYLKATSIVEKMLSALHSDEIKFFFAADKFKIYARIVDCLLELGNIEKSYIQHMKALSLVNSKEIYQQKLSNKIPSEILSEIKSLRSLLTQAFKFPRQGKRELSNQSIVEQEKKLWRLEQKVRGYQSKLKQINTPTNQQNALYNPASHEAILSYFISGESVGLFLQTSSDISYCKIKTPLGELSELIRKNQFLFENSINSSSFDDSLDVKTAYLQKLYNILIAPAQLSSNITSLIITPVDILNQVPFIALIDNTGAYLKDSCNINIIPDTSALVQKRKEHTDFSILRNSIFAVSHPTIPHVKNESVKISQTFNKNVSYSDEKATCSAFTSELRNSTGFVHIATHASRSSENPLFSKLMFADGVLYPFNLFETRIKAKLVTLSGCQTAAPGLNYGNTFSLAKTFYRAGSRFVLASLWQVDDQFTMLFMNEFYKNLSQVNNVHTAYEIALKYISTRITDPSYWGAFVLIGI